jgi:hypothetical protein
MPPVPSTAIADPPVTGPEERSSLSPGSEEGLQVSEETYWRQYYAASDIKYEWNDGRLEEKPVSDYATYLVCHWFLLLLSHFLKTRPIAKHVGLDMGFRLRLRDRVVIRKPDLAIVHNDNPQPLLYHDASYHGIFDICVEGLSDLDQRGIERDTLTKKAEYAAGGVPEYFILHDEPRYQRFYGLNDAGVYVPIEPQDGVIRSRVLPGFQFRMSDLVERRDDEALRDDPVYADFVLPKWREDRERAAAAAQRAEMEAQRAETQARRAEMEAQRADTEAQRAGAEALRAAAEARRAEAETLRAEAEAQARAAAEHRASEAEAELARLRAQLGDRAAG